jgi:TPR repeat protein
MSNLGGCYFFGLDVPEDRREGIRWYKRSADTGNAFGMFNYANCRLHGHGCVQVCIYLQSSKRGLRFLYYFIYG